MRLLLDTHAYLWAVGDTAKLGRRTRSLIAERDNDVFVSVVSLWEIVLKSDKLEADIPQLLKSVEPSGFTLLPLAVAHLERQIEMGRLFADPFDRLLVAQAAQERLALVTEDDTILSRPPVDLIECSTGRRVKVRP